MTTLPTYAECAAVPPEKRTALERLMYYVDGFFIVHSDAVKANLRAVIEEERKKRDALAAELERVRALSIWGTSVPVGPSYDRLLELEDENTRLRDTREKELAYIDEVLTNIMRQNGSGARESASDTRAWLRNRRAALAATEKKP